jgi:hypothetical protein
MYSQIRKWFPLSMTKAYYHVEDVMCIVTASSSTTK